MILLLNFKNEPIQQKIGKFACFTYFLQIFVVFAGILLTMPFFNGITIKKSLVKVIRKQIWQKNAK